MTNAAGRPVENAYVVRVMPGTLVWLEDGLFNQADRIPNVMTDKNGHFKLPRAEPPYLILATHYKAGYAEIFTDRTTDNFDIQLIAWARLEGKVLIGDKPVQAQR